MKNAIHLTPNRCVLCGDSSVGTAFFKPNNPAVFGMTEKQEIVYGLCEEHVSNHPEAFSPLGIERNRRLINTAIARRMGIEIETEADA
jgi:hypothetical protein